jgi:DNA-binding transcriptional LysR family regulator
MELRELRVLVAIAEHGTVAQAAKALHHSPSSVSHALSSLETKVGARLFDRVARGMVLTNAGHAMLDSAHRILREADAAVAAVAAVDGLLGGQVTLVCGRMMSVWLADLLSAFHRDHPAVLVRVHHPEPEESIPELLRSGECELGFMRVETIPNDLDGTPVAGLTGAIIVPSDHPLATLEALDLAALDGEPFIVPARLGPTFDALFHRSGAVPRVVAVADDTETIFELVRAGVGVAIASMENVAPIVGRGAVALPITPPLTSTVAVVTRRDAELGPPAAALRALAIERFATLPA